MYFAIITFSHIFLGSVFINIWLQFMYFYWKRLCIIIVIYVYLLLVYVIRVVYVFLHAATLTEVFPCFFLSCKANARV